MQQTKEEKWEILRKWNLKSDIENKSNVFITEHGIYKYYLFGDEKLNYLLSEDVTLQLKPDLSKDKIIVALPEEWMWDRINDILKWKRDYWNTFKEKIVVKIAYGKFQSYGKIEDYDKYVHDYQFLSFAEFMAKYFPNENAEKPEKKYRAFETIEEVRPFRDSWLKGLDHETRIDEIGIVNGELKINNMASKYILDNYNFENGEPVGVEVTDV